MVSTTNVPAQSVKGVFIAGTDTNVGKTVVTAALGVALRQTGADVGVMKPVETRAARDATASVSDARRLRELFTPQERMESVSPYSLPAPIAPVEAARLAHTRIALHTILNAYRTLASRHEYMLVEGVGGVLVPLTQTQDVRDLIELLGLPCLVVSRTGLGAINHTRLTLRSLRESGIPIAGVLLTRTIAETNEDTRLQTATTATWIRTLSGVPVFGPLPFQPCMESQWETGIHRLANDATMREVAKMLRGID